jgi:phage tail sheath protein FI
MEIAAFADEIGETFMFEEIDGQGRTVNAFGAALTSMLLPYWEIGSLYGATADQAFFVDVGPSVNTPTTIQNRELRAAISVRPSPFAEMITIEIVKQQITD